MKPIYRYSWKLSEWVETRFSKLFQEAVKRANDPAHQRWVTNTTECVDVMGIPCRIEVITPFKDLCKEAN